MVEFHRIAPGGFSEVERERRTPAVVESGNRLRNSEFVVGIAAGLGIEKNFPAVFG
jgi:hypothetical protein